MDDFAQWRRSEGFRRKRSGIAAGTSNAFSRGSTSEIATWWISGYRTSTRSSKRCTPRDSRGSRSRSMRTASGRSSATPRRGLGVRLANLVAGPRIYRHHELPVGPSWDEVRKLIESTASDDPADIRDRAIIMLFAVYGLRAGEVAGLRLEDIDWEQETGSSSLAQGSGPEPSLSARPLGRAGHHPLPQGSPPKMVLAPGVSEGPRSGRAADLPEPLSDSRGSPEAPGD
jgi:integrase